MAITTSTAGTEYMLDLATKHLESRKAYLERLVASDEILVEVRVGPRSQKATKLVTVKRTDTYAISDDCSLEGAIRVFDGTPDARTILFETEKKNQIRQVKGDIEATERAIALYARKIAEWTP
jgi:hypothetical protein